MGDKLQKYKELEGKVNSIINKQHSIEAEKKILQRSISESISELKERGIEFKDREDLERQLIESNERLEINYKNLERKISEYEDLITEEVPQVEIKEEIY